MVNNIQHKIVHMQRAYEHQYEHPEAESEPYSESKQEDIHKEEQVASLDGTSESGSD